MLCLTKYVCTKLIHYALHMNLIGDLQCGK